MAIHMATRDDVPMLVSLLNSTYRGTGSKEGWTSEADLIQGDLRTDEPTLLKLMKTSNAVFLKYAGAANEIEGCVFLHKQKKKLYLGMLSVSPLLQAKGIGRQLMAAADEYARQKKCTGIFMRVISVRHELIAWYERQGYVPTGKREPFPDDKRFGIPVQPLEFIIMEKPIY